MAQQKFNFDSKVVIVTGAAEGIGKSIAAAFSDCGATVIVSDIQTAKGKAAAQEIGAIFQECDITQKQQVESLIDLAVSRFGRLDVMVNNAGINTTNASDRVTIDQYSDSTWHKIIDVDLNGTFNCCKAASCAMVKQKSGNIINIASIAGVVALRLQVAFVAAKAAVIKMTEAMACELGLHGIRVNAVSPGSVITETTRKLFYSETGLFSENAKKLMSFIPQARPGEPSEIAQAVLFLASDQASYINGHNLIVDGGWVKGFSRDF
jgi:3-oxoacyl-[acyl-carrier protein] reductase